MLGGWLGPACLDLGRGGAPAASVAFMGCFPKGPEPGCLPLCALRSLLGAGSLRVVAAVGCACSSPLGQNQNLPCACPEGPDFQPFLTGRALTSEAPGNGSEKGASPGKGCRKQGQALCCPVHPTSSSQPSSSFPAPGCSQQPPLSAILRPPIWLPGRAVQA